MTLTMFLKQSRMLITRPRPANLTSVAGQAQVSERALMLWLSVLVTCTLLLFSQGAITDRSDGRSMYEVTKNLVETGSLAIESRYGFSGHDGKFYASHGLGLPLAALLPYIAARPIAQRTGREAQVTEAAVASLIPLLTGLLTVALYRLARRLGANIRDAVLVAIGAACGTYLLAFAKEFFSEPLATLFLVLAIERALAQCPVASGLAAAAAALTRPQYFAFAPILVWRLWRDGGWTAAAKSVLPLTVGLLLAVSYNVARFGNPAEFGYAGLGFRTPLLHGAAGLLFHPEKSIFIFAPIVVLIPFSLCTLWRINRTAFWLLTGNLALTLITAAKWIDWYGGWVWGPRTLIPGIIPAIAATAYWTDGQHRRGLLVTSLFMLGFVVSAPTLVVSQRAQLIHQPPEYGPSVLRQISLVPETVRFTSEHLFDQSSSRFRYERYVNTWQVHALRAVGQRGILPVCVLSLLLVAAAVLSARKLQKAVRHMPATSGVTLQNSSLPRVVTAA